MLVIRTEQLEAFRRIILDRFEDTVFEKLKKYWPKIVASKGEEAIRQFIRKGRRRAERYGIVTEYDVTRYINVMFALGHGFDRDDQYPWARELLEYPNVNPTVRMDWLCERTKKELPKLRLRRRRRHDRRV